MVTAPRHHKIFLKTFMETETALHPTKKIRTIMKKILLLTMMLFAAAVVAFSQTASRTITGVVTAYNDGLPLPGITIRVVGTNLGTQTNAAGKYTITVPAGKETLTFSFVGFDTQSVKIGKKDRIDVALVASSRQLNEVIVSSSDKKMNAPVIRGYVRRSREQTTGASTIITEKEVQNVPVANVEQLLQGKVAGVNVQSATGAPGFYGSANISGLAAAPAPTDESYNKFVENKYQNPVDNPLSTFSVDVDNASYSNVRRFINQGQMPPKDAVRIEEMINYFKYQLPKPVGDEPVAIATELAAAPWNANHRLLRIGLKAREIPMDKLPESNLVFLIDVSGSMDQANKLPLVKQSMKMLVEQLRKQDKVAIVVYAGQAGLVLPSTPGNEKEKINEAIDNLSAGGSTAGGAGIMLAYKVAAENFKKGGNKRIVLATDGDFNVGASSDQSMEELITEKRKNGVDLSIMGFGMGNYKDSKMETLADKGNGNYAYIDNITEAHKALVSEFGGTMFTVAKDVKLQLEFNPAKVQAYRLIGYENRMLAKEDFNNDKKDAGDMGSGHTVTALYEIIPAGIKDDYAGSVDALKYQKTDKKAPAASASAEMLTIKFRYKQPQGDVSKMQQVTVMDTPKNFDKQSADYRFAAAVAEAGMLLRDSEYKNTATYDQAISIAKAAKGDDDEGYRSEFVRLMQSVKSMAKAELAKN